MCVQVKSQTRHVGAERSVRKRGTEDRNRRGIKGTRICTIALMLMDLDRFKEVNDTHGHQSGDLLIQSFASRIASIVRATDTVSRLGGDEFAVLLIDRGDPSDVDAVCQRILEAASKPFEVDGARVYIGASIGIAETVDEVTNVSVVKNLGTVERFS